jgi:putative spermidine/putrescine transport system substrate-binding protein
MRASVVAMAAVALGICGATQAQDKTLYVAGYGGSFEQVMRKDVFPAFEKANGVKIEYVAGNSTDTLAKLQAQRGN